MRSDPLVLGAAIAARTTRLRIGTLTLSPLYRHTGVIARGLADLDALSSGRVVFGAGLGGAAPDVRRLGLVSPTNAEREARLRALVTIVEGLWGADAPLTFADAQVQIDAWRLWPRGVQERLPLLIAGGGERRTLRLVAELADACNLQPDDFLHERLTPETIRHKLEVLRRHCADIGRDPEMLLVTAWNGYTLCAPTEHEVQQKLRALCPNGLQPSAAIFHAGTPAQLAETYAAWVRAGVHYPVLQPIAASDHETLHLLANDVLPAVRTAR
jgi:alkanesulfonate monooxygenase SsuD/methylene tetrahydromethanopterin reductase-like flavin-dependent oxidoreductase (luciferase family)